MFTLPSAAKLNKKKLALYTQKLPTRFSLSLWRMNRLKQDGTAELVLRDQILRLTTSRIGNLTRLIHTLLNVMTSMENE